MAKVFKVPRKSRVYLKHRITNAVCEGLNSKIQWVSATRTSPSFSQSQLDLRHKPRRRDSQNLFKHLAVLHGTPPRATSIPPSHRRFTGLHWWRRAKRSRALLRSNPTRDNPARGASKRRPQRRLLLWGTLNTFCYASENLLRTLPRDQSATPDPEAPFQFP